MNWRMAQPPLFGVTMSRSSAGKTIYVLPPNPMTPNNQMLVVRDWIEYPEDWQKRDQRRIVGISADGNHLLEMNWGVNSRLGPWNDWRKLWGKEYGKTCVLLSCGPSLRESLPEIRERAKDPDVFTMTINRGFRAFKTDYYFVLDRRGSPDWIPEGADTKGTTLIASTTCNPFATLPFERRYWGEHMLTEKTAPVALLGVDLALTICDAMMVAYKLGARRIELYGCDYAISGSAEKDKDGEMFVWDRYYHDTPLRSKSLDFRNRRFPVHFPFRGINDRLIFTNWELMCYAVYTTTMAIMLSRGGVEVRNKTPCGILYETWRQFEEKEQEVSVAAC